MTVLVTIVGAQAAAGAAAQALQPSAAPPQAEHPADAPQESHAGAAEPHPESQLEQLDSQQPEFLRNRPAWVGPARLATSSATAGVRLNNLFNMVLLSLT